MRLPLFCCQNKIFCFKICVCAIFLLILQPISAALAELVDALDLGSSFERSEGSSPLCRTSGHETRFFVSKVQGITNISYLIVKY